jgi:tetratricopeptide (TPR) repeat protein
MLHCFAIVALLLTVALVPVEAATLKGVILANELSGRPVENVEVDATSGTNHTESDSSGKFTLEFPLRRAGDIVRIIVKKEGYVVVNDVQLQLAVPADADTAPLIIILAREGDREEMARRFYRLKSFEAIEETYKKRLEELHAKHIADAAVIAKLQQERDQAKGSAEKASEELAKNQPGQSSELYEQAKRFFLDGKIEEAVQLLRNNDEKRRESVAQAKRAIEQEKKVIENAVQEWLLTAQLLTVQFHFDDAETAYRKAIEAAPDSFAAHFAYGSFNQQLNRSQQATTAYSRCLELARKGANKAELADTLNRVGLLDRDQGRMEEARQEYAEALQIRRELAQKDPETYLSDVAQTLNSVGVLDRDQGQMEKARQEFVEALQIRRELAKENPETYRDGVALTLNNVGALDRDQGRMEEARKEFEEALKIYRELAQEEPETYRSYVALTLNNLGLVDSDQGRIEEARQEFAEVVETYRELAQRNPEAYRPDLALTLNNVGGLDRDQGRMEEARKEFTEALQIQRELAQKSPEGHRTYVAGALSNLGALDSDQGRTEEARQEYAEALQTYRELAQKNPETYRPDVARTLYALGIFDSKQSRIDEARKEYAEAVETYRELAQKNAEI